MRRNKIFINLSHNLKINRAKHIFTKYQKHSFNDLINITLDLVQNFENIVLPNKTLDSCY